MPKICNHTSVGIVVINTVGNLLLIERAKFPFGFALPAGHVEDGESFEEAAVRELGEEVGIKNVALTLLAKGRKENPCRRENGTWHQWEIFGAIRRVDEAEVKRSLDETKKTIWCDVPKFDELMLRAEKNLRGEISEEDWNTNPGMEPVMHDWLKALTEEDAQTSIMTAFIRKYL